MKLSHLMILIVVFAVLAVLVARRGREASPGGGAAGVVSKLETSLKPSGFDRAKVAEIAFSRPDASDPIKLRKTADGWVVASAWNAPADAERVERLLDAVDHLRGALRSEVPASHERYGLRAEEALRITMGAGPGKDGAVAADLLDLLVGKAPEDLYSGNYVRLAKDERSYVCTTLRPLLNAFDSDIPKVPARKFWIDAVVAKVDPKSIDRIELKTPDRVVVLAKNASAAKPVAAEAKPAAAEAPTVAGGKPAEATSPTVAEAPDSAGKAAGKPVVVAAKAEAASTPAEVLSGKAWTVVQGGWHQASEPRVEAVERMLALAGDVRAADVDDPAGAAAKALAAPARTWTATLADGRTVTFDATREEGDAGRVLLRASTRPGLVYVVSDEVWNDLFPAGNALFDLAPPRPETAAVNHVEYQRGRHAFSFERRAGEWKTVAGPGFAPRTGAVAALLRAAGDWRPEDYADAESRERFGFVDPRARVTFVTPGGATALALGDAEGSLGEYVDVGGSQALLASAADTGKLFPAFSEMFDLVLFDADPADVAGVTVTRAGEPAVALKRSVPPAGPAPADAADAAGWGVAKDGGGALERVETGKATAVLEHLTALAGVDLYSGPAESVYDWNDVRVKVETAKGAVDVAFGPAAGGLRPAKVAERVAVMVTEKDVEALLKAVADLSSVPEPKTEEPAKPAPAAGENVATAEEAAVGTDKAAVLEKTPTAPEAETVPIQAEPAAAAPATVPTAASQVEMAPPEPVAENGPNVEGAAPETR